MTTYTEPDGFHDPADVSVGPRIFSALNGICDYGIVQRVGVCFSPVGWHPLATAECEIGEAWWGGYVEKRMS